VQPRDRDDIPALSLGVLSTLGFLDGAVLGVGITFEAEPGIDGAPHVKLSPERKFEPGRV